MTIQSWTSWSQALRGLLLQLPHMAREEGCQATCNESLKFGSGFCLNLEIYLELAEYTSAISSSFFFQMKSDAAFSTSLWLNKNKTS